MLERLCEDEQFRAVFTPKLVYVPGREGIYRLNDLMNVSQDVSVAECLRYPGAKQAPRYLKTQCPAARTMILTRRVCLLARWL